MKTYPLRTFVHRVLLIRIGIATILIAAAIATITYFTQETRLKRQVADYAKKGAEVIVSEVREVMQSRSLDAADALQAVVKQHRSSTVYDASRFVSVQFYDLSLKVVAEWQLDGHPDIGRYRAFLTSEPMLHPEVAIEILDQGRGGHFDPDILDAFHKIARELYDRYASRESDDLRQELISVVKKCFSSGLEALRYGTG